MSRGVATLLALFAVTVQSYSQFLPFSLRPAAIAFLAKSKSSYSSTSSMSRIASPLLVEEDDESIELNDKQRAAQVVAWFDELAMLEVVCRGDIEYDEGSADSSTIETVIAASGGNVSRYLMPEERVLPDGASPALKGLCLTQVSFTLDLSEYTTVSSLSDLRLRVVFASGYPLFGGLPAFEALSSAPLSADQSAAVVGAAEAAAEAAVKAMAGNAVYTALAAARDAAENLEEVTEGGGSSGDDDDDANERSQSSEEAPAEPTSGGAWAVLGGCGKALHSVLVAWDTQRSYTASQADFRRAAQALAALGIASRTPTDAELDAMYEGLCDGRRVLPLARLLEPLDVVAGLIERKLRGIEVRSWSEIDKWADQTYDWYTAARSLRRNPACWRDAPNSRGRNLFDADRKPAALHLFAADPGNWGEDGHLVSLAACAVLVSDRQGRGVAKLTQLCVSPEATSEGFEWEWRLLEAADLIAEQKGHLWLAVSAPEESAWRDALLARGFRLQSVVPGEHDGKWLFKGTRGRRCVEEDS